MRLWTYVFREMRGRPGRTLLTLLGIALGTATVSATSLTNQAVRRAYHELFERLVTGHRDIFLEAWHAHFDV